jgi:hypothetical protein
VFGRSYWPLATPILHKHVRVQTTFRDFPHCSGLMHQGRRRGSSASDKYDVIVAVDGCVLKRSIGIGPGLRRMMDTNFRELCTRELRRIPLLLTSVNKGKSVRVWSLRHFRQDCFLARATDVLRVSISSKTTEDPCKIPTNLSTSSCSTGELGPSISYCGLNPAVSCNL